MFFQRDCIPTLSMALPASAYLATLSQQRTARRGSSRATQASNLRALAGERPLDAVDWSHVVPQKPQQAVALRGVLRQAFPPLATPPLRPMRRKRGRQVRAYLPGRTLLRQHAGTVSNGRATATLRLQYDRAPTGWRVNHNLAAFVRATVARRCGNLGIACLEMVLDGEIDLLPTSVLAVARAAVEVWRESWTW